MSGDLTYRRPMSTWWWVHKRTYFVFAMRELSSLFLAWLVLYLLLFARAVFLGGEAYTDFLDLAASWPMLTVNTVAFLFALLHTVTWFGVTPQAMDLRLGGRRVPAAVVILAQYVALAAVSAFVYWLVVR